MCVDSFLIFSMSLMEGFTPVTSFYDRSCIPNSTVLTLIDASIHTKEEERYQNWCDAAPLSDSESGS